LEGIFDDLLELSLLGLEYTRESRP
jgi:hypothetical protein